MCDSHHFQTPHGASYSTSMVHRGVVVAGLLVGLGCGSSTDRVSSICGRVADASCARLVECHALGSGGVAVSAALCQQARADEVSQCVTDDGATISASTDAQADTCVQDLAAQPCTEICNQVPQDPPSCNPLSPAPNTDMITCQAS